MINLSNKHDINHKLNGDKYMKRAGEHILNKDIRQLDILFLTRRLHEHHRIKDTVPETCELSPLDAVQFITYIYTPSGQLCPFFFPSHPSFGSVLVITGVPVLS